MPRSTIHRTPHHSVPSTTSHHVRRMSHDNTPLHHVPSHHVTAHDATAPYAAHNDNTSQRPTSRHMAARHTTARDLTTPHPTPPQHTAITTYLMPNFLKVRHDRNGPTVIDVSHSKWGIRDRRRSMWDPGRTLGVSRTRPVWRQLRELPQGTLDVGRRMRVRVCGGPCTIDTNHVKAIHMRHTVYVSYTTIKWT